MDQNSNMGGFAPMPGQNGMGGNNTVVMPDGAQAAAAPMPGAAPANNMQMGTPMMPGAPMGPSAPVTPGMAGAANANAAVAGKKNSTLIETIILVVVCLIAAAAIVFAVTFFMQYNELKTNFDSQKGLAEAQARKEQEDSDNKAFEEREKLPYYSFTGPSDYGSISFQYPKTWSVYIESDGMNNSDFKSYFRPAQVDPITSKDSRYALRFMILNKQYDSVQKTYESKVKNGKLRPSVFNADNGSISGMKYEGEVDNNINGIVVLIKINDKTAIFQMDAEVYREDFEKLLQGIRRNSN